MTKQSKNYYIYIITNKKNGTLYTGVTNNLIRRIYEHKNKLVEGFSKKYSLDKLVYYEQYSTIGVYLNSSYYTSILLVLRELKKEYEY